MTVLVALAALLALLGGAASRGDALCRCAQSNVECASRRPETYNSLRTAFGQCVRTQRGQTTHVQVHNAALASIDLFTSLPASSFASLRSLDLRGNQLQSVDGSALIQLAPQLQNLSLSRNQLTEFPRFPSGNKLIHLSLFRNRIESLPDAVLANLTNLRYLDLSKNHITELPARWSTQSGQNALLELNLSNNSIVNPCNITSLANLETLRLSDNKISQLARECFTQLPRLRTLDLSRNSIETIEGLTFNSLTSLTTLVLRNNRISTLLDGAFFFKSFDKLERLELDFNEISSVEGKWLFSLGQLKVLSLSHNRITRICDGAWDFTKQLLELDLRYNELHSLDADRFKGLLLLQRLSLSDNRLVTIDRNAFAGLASLQRLDLANNNLSLADDPPFTELLALRELNLTNNSISLLSANKLTGLRDSLRSISMLDNPLRIVVLDTFRSLRNLEALQLSSVELVCDCGLIDFVSWFKQFASTPLSDSKRLLDVVALCGFPDALRGLNVFDLSVDELRCDSVTRPTLIREPESEVKAVRFRNLTLECVAQVSDDVRDLQFGWLKENEPLINSSKVLIEVTRLPNDLDSELPSSAFTTRFVTVRSTLHFRYVDYVDAATYQCMVQSGGATAFETRSRRVSVRVHVAPQLTVMPQSATVHLGETAKLDCVAKGDPVPTISWNKDGNRDFPAARERRIQFVDRDTAILIVDVREADAGVYTCVASNLVGRISANASLRIVDAPPRFVEPLLRNTVVNRSAAAVLNCFVDSVEQRVDIRWFFAPSGAAERAVVVGDGRYQTIPSKQTLIVTNVAEADEGTYACVASNSAGTRRQEARLTVSSGADWRDNSQAQVPSSDSSLSLSQLVGMDSEDEEFESDELDEPVPVKDATVRPQTLATITVSYEHVLVIVVCVCVVVTSCVWVLVFWIRARRARSAALKRCQATRLLLPSNVATNYNHNHNHNHEHDERCQSATMLSVNSHLHSQSQRSPNCKFTPIESVEMMTKRSTDSDYVSSESHSNGNTSPTVCHLDELSRSSVARQSPAEAFSPSALVHRPSTLGVLRSQTQLTSGSPLHDDSPLQAPNCFGCVSNRNNVAQTERHRESRSIPLQRRALLLPPSQTLLTALFSSRSPSTADCSLPHSMLQSLVAASTPRDTVQYTGTSGAMLPCTPIGPTHSHSAYRMDLAANSLAAPPYDPYGRTNHLAHSTSVNGNLFRQVVGRPTVNDAKTKRESIIWVENEQATRWLRSDLLRSPVEIVESSVDS